MGSSGALHNGRARISLSAVKLVKQQLNGTERTVLKDHASTADLIAAAARLRTQLGYRVQADERAGRYLATHPFFSGKFLLSLEPE